MVNLIKLFFTAFYLLFSFYSPLVAAKFTTLNHFGENPGELSASYYQPEIPSETMVVLLHGCIQNGQELAQQSGLLSLAKKKNFALLIPQQHSENNIKDCFNWFSAQDTSADSGELLSIKNMTFAFKNKIQAKEIFIIGLSAGGAMTSAMLVHYPELFTAGAVVAGLPYPCADNLIKAISCMRSGPAESVGELAKQVNELKGPRENWPRLSVWTGSDDNVVNPINSQFLAKQWARLNGLSASSPSTKESGYQQTQWLDENQQVIVELIQVEKLGHGMPVNPAVENGGMEAPFVLKSPLSSVIEIIGFWQINGRNK